MTKTRQWTLFTALAVVVVLLAGWLLLVKPQKSHASSLRATAASQESQNALTQTQIAALQAEERQLPQQQLALQKFATQVPIDAAEPAIIRQLSAAAAGSGVDLISITPGVASVVTSASAVPGSTTLTTPGASGQLISLPISIGITGTFPNVESFFQSLEKLPRALLVQGWSLCPDPSVAGSGGGVACTLPPTPSNKTLPEGALGGTLSAVVFYAPPAGTVIVPSVGTTTPTTATTPTPATSPSATPTPTVASTAPAN
jgi:Tfp pilus assembly protein PilO